MQYHCKISNFMRVKWKSSRRNVKKIILISTIGNEWKRVRRIGLMICVIRVLWIYWTSEKVNSLTIIQIKINRFLSFSPLRRIWSSKIRKKRTKHQQLFKIKKPVEGRKFFQFYCKLKLFFLWFIRFHFKTNLMSNSLFVSYTSLSSRHLLFLWMITKPGN